MPTVKIKDSKGREVEVICEKDTSVKECKDIADKEHEAMISRERAEAAGTDFAN